MYPESIPLCQGIALLSLISVLYSFSMPYRYKFKKPFYLKFFLWIIILLFISGTVLNAVSIYYRWVLFDGPFTVLWHRGMDCYYLCIIGTLIYILVYLYGYIENKKI